MKDEINRQFGDSLRRLREERGLRRWELAAKVGLSPDTIGAYERGEGSPTLSAALKIARALDSTLDEMVPQVNGFQS